MYCWSNPRHKYTANLLYLYVGISGLAVGFSCSGLSPDSRKDSALQPEPLSQKLDSGANELENSRLSVEEQGIQVQRYTCDSGYEDRVFQYSTFFFQKNGLTESLVPSHKCILNDLLINIYSLYYYHGIAVDMIHLAGYTSIDEKSNERERVELSAERAEMLKKQLIDLGVKPEIISAAGYGEICPIEIHECNDCFQEELSRRVEVKLISANGIRTRVQPACDQARKLGLVGDELWNDQAQEIPLPFRNTACLIPKSEVSGKDVPFTREIAPKWNLEGCMNKSKIPEKSSKVRVLFTE